MLCMVCFMNMSWISFLKNVVVELSVNSIGL